MRETAAATERKASRRRSVLKMLYSVSSAVKDCAGIGRAFGRAGGALFETRAGRGIQPVQRLLEQRPVGW